MFEYYTSQWSTRWWSFFSTNSLKIILDFKKTKKRERDSLCYIANIAYIAMSSSRVPFSITWFYILEQSPPVPVMCTHARARGLLCRLEGRKYGVHTGMNYDRDFSSSGSLRESHRSAKLVGVSIARLFAKEVWLSRKPPKNYIATTRKFVNFMPKNTINVSWFIKRSRLSWMIYRFYIFGETRVQFGISALFDDRL